MHTAFPAAAPYRRRYPGKKYAKIDLFYFLDVCRDYWFSAGAPQESKTKTWPPKAPWQHSTHTNTMPNPSSSLYQMSIPPSSQWSESMQMLQSPVWSTAGDCSASAGISSGYPFTQQQQQQQQQHKPMTKGFKSFPLKPEHRPSYLHQY